MVKWSLWRKYKSEYLEKWDKTRDKLFRATDFAHMISFYSLVRKHRENCRLKIWIRRRIAEMTEKRQKLIDWIQDRLVRIGPSFEQRQTQLLKFGILAGHQVMCQPYDLEAKDTFVEFLEKTAFVNEMIHKTVMTHY